MLIAPPAPVSLHPNLLTLMFPCQGSKLINLDPILPMFLKNSWEMQKGIYRFFILQKFMCAYNLFYSSICIYVISICSMYI